MNLQAKLTMILAMWRGAMMSMVTCLLLVWSDDIRFGAGGSEGGAAIGPDSRRTWGWWWGGWRWWWWWWWRRRTRKMMMMVIFFCLAHLWGNIQSYLSVTLYYNSWLNCWNCLLPLLSASFSTLVRSTNQNTRNLSRKYCISVGADLDDEKNRKESKAETTSGTPTRNSFRKVRQSYSFDTDSPGKRKLRPESSNLDSQNRGLGKRTMRDWKTAETGFSFLSFGTRNSGLFGMGNTFQIWDLCSYCINWTNYLLTKLNGTLQWL